MMASNIGREARAEALLAAARRWTERSSSRAESDTSISTFGVGAGDTEKRRLEWQTRQITKRRNIIRFGERVIDGADFVSIAPSPTALLAARPVGRITTLPGKRFEPQGIATGFLIPGNLLITNWHVFPTRSDVAGSAVNFDHFESDLGVQTGSYFEFDPARFFISDFGLDFAIVAVKPTGLDGESLANQGSVRLIEATGKVLTGQPLNIIQHPDGGPRRFAYTNNRLLDILPSGFLHYQTDTRPGSSGAPVSNQDWELVGVHHCGVPLMKNGDIIKSDGTVWDSQRDEEDSIKWVANECARVSAVVEKLRAMSATTVEEQAILASILASTSDPIVPKLDEVTMQERERPAAAKIPQSSSPVFNISGPVTINFYGNAEVQRDIVGPSPTPDTTAPKDPIEVALTQEKALLFDADYSGREGYDAMFLGVEIPVPSVIESRQEELYSCRDYQEYFDSFRNVPEVPTAEGDDALPLELHYHHYSLVFNKRFRMCHWTASNCDYRAVERQDSRPRRELGGEDWAYDPRVPVELQLGNADIYLPAKRIDRGHVVRREDNAWGAPGLSTDYSNSDTYHWTNCTPQHEAFNQENPSDKNKKKTRIYDGLSYKGIWGHFEATLQRLITQGGGQATIFAGPVLSDFFPDDDWGKGAISVPKLFWKVFVIPASTAKQTELISLGYIFSQEPAVQRFGMTYEEIELPNFLRQRASLEEISTLAGVNFPQIILDAEQAI